MFSLPDWAFLPLSAAAIAAMIAGALSFGDSQRRTPEEIFANGLLYEGDRLSEVTTGNGLEAEYLIENGAAFLRIAAIRAPLDGTPSAGAFFALSPSELGALEGHRVRLSFDIRSAPEAGSEGARLSFFVPGIGQNSWQRHNLANTFETIEIEIEPPSCNWDYAYIGLWPDWTANANTIDLSRATLTVLEPLSC